MSHMVRLALTFLLLLIAETAAFAQCPSISVIGPAGLTDPGGEMVFTVEGGTADLKYHWSVSAGYMIKGQGSPAVTVSTSGAMEGSNVTATVRIEGLDVRCPSAFSEMALIAMRPIGEPIDEWADSISSNDKRARLDSFFAELANNPDHVGVVIVVVTGKERRDHRNPRVQLVLRHAKFRNFDRNRIWFAFEAGAVKRIVIWRMHPSVGVPCTNCLIIKGGDLK